MKKWHTRPEKGKIFDSIKKKELAEGNGGFFCLFLFICLNDYITFQEIDEQNNGIHIFGLKVMNK